MTNSAAFPDPDDVPRPRASVVGAGPRSWTPSSSLVGIADSFEAVQAPTRPNLDHLSAEAVLGDLPTHRYCVSLEALGLEVEASLRHNPDLPGAMIVDHDRLLGVVSRRRVFEKVGRPFGVEMYLRRPVHVLLDIAVRDPLTLDEDCDIGTAARAALGRQAELIYEPIVVRLATGECRLVDMSVLLLAQSRLLAIANAAIRQQVRDAEEAARAKGEFVAE